MSKNNSLIKVFIVEDDTTTADLMQLSLESEFPHIEITHFSNGEACLKNLHVCPDIIIIDYQLPGISGLELLDKVKNYNGKIKTIFVSRQKEVEVVLKIFKAGANEYLMKDDNCLALLSNTIKNFISTISLDRENVKLKEQIIDRNKYSNILGNSTAIINVLKMLEKAEKSNMLVLITGESGTGKELIANAIHYNSDRKDHLLIAINMAAIPETLIESELFGFEKGSFTGAEGKRVGKFEEANKGSIFLDEIGEMSLSLQSKLLRVLEEKKITRIGSNKPISIDVKIITATNKNLKEEVAKGNFRQDLYYRLQGFLIKLPLLKERGDDIILLARKFLKEFLQANALPEVSIDKNAHKKLMQYDWPGNVRELKAAIERAALIAENGVISENDIIF